MRARKNICSVSVTTVTGTYKDLADFGYTVDTWVDALSGPSKSLAVASVPGKTETVKLSTTPTVKPGQFQIVGTVIGATIAEYLTNIRNLKGWANDAVALKLLALDTTTFIEVDQTEAPVVHIGPPGVTPASRVTITFDALKPYWQSTSVTSNAITTSFTEQALGTLKVYPVIRFTGAPSGLTLTYADSAGTTVQTLTLAGLTTSGATYTEIDMANSTVSQMISAVLTNAIDKKTTGDFFALSPKDSDRVTPTWCKLKYSLSGGSVSGVTCDYRKLYL